MKLKNNHCEEHDKFLYKCNECCKAYQRWHYQENKEKYNERSRQYYKDNKHRELGRGTRNARKRLLGVTEEEFQYRLQLQEYRCGICTNEFKNSKDQCVDHNHITGKVRGILCRSCNLALGQFKDSKRILQDAVIYLERNDT